MFESPFPSRQSHVPRSPLPRNPTAGAERPHCSLSVLLRGRWSPGHSLARTRLPPALPPTQQPAHTLPVEALSLVRVPLILADSGRAGHPARTCSCRPRGGADRCCLRQRYPPPARVHPWPQTTLPTWSPLTGPRLLKPGQDTISTSRRPRHIHTLICSAALQDHPGGQMRLCRHRVRNRLPIHLPRCAGALNTTEAQPTEAGFYSRVPAVACQPHKLGRTITLNKLLASEGVLKRAVTAQMIT